MLGFCSGISEEVADWYREKSGNDKYLSRGARAVSPGPYSCSYSPEYAGGLFPKFVA